MDVSILDVGTTTVNYGPTLVLIRSNSVKVNKRLLHFTLNLYCLTPLKPLFMYITKRFTGIHEHRINRVANQYRLREQFSSLLLLSFKFSSIKTKTFNILRITYLFRLKGLPINLTITTKMLKNLEII